MRSIPSLLMILLLAGCSLSGPPPAPINTPTAIPSNTSAPSVTPTITATPTLTLTPALTLTPTILPTPTFAFPTVTVYKQAHCRYGPSVAYLHAADLYAGDKGTVRGRHPYISWLYLKFDKLDYFCRAAPSVVDVSGMYPHCAPLSRTCRPSATACTCHLKT